MSKKEINEEELKLIYSIACVVSDIGVLTADIDNGNFREAQLGSVMIKKNIRILDKYFEINKKMKDIENDDVARQLMKNIATAFAVYIADSKKDIYDNIIKNKGLVNTKDLNKDSEMKLINGE